MQGFLASNAATVVGGLATGPLFGWFGQQWRTRRAIVGALVTAAALCLEPLARHIPTRIEIAVSGGHFAASPIGSHAVVAAEVAAGLALAVTALVLARRAQQTRDRAPVSTS